MPWSFIYKPTPSPTPAPTMQSFRCSDIAKYEQGTMTDVRDGNTYTIAKLYDDRCWMVEDLRFTQTELDPATSDVRTAKTLEWYSIDDANHLDLRKYAFKKDSYNGVVGVWYNYAAATAMSITGSSYHPEDATESICPKGWKLPTHSQAMGLLNDNLHAFTIHNKGSFWANEYNNIDTDWWTASQSVNGDPERATILVQSGSGVGVHYVFQRGRHSALIRCVQE